MPSRDVPKNFHPLKLPLYAFRAIAELPTMIKLARRAALWGAQIGEHPDDSFARIPDPAGEREQMWERIFR